MSDEYPADETPPPAAIGLLAQGIGHDLSNLLTAIGGYARLLLDSLEPGDARREDAEQIRRATDRAALLTRRLLTISRGDSVGTEPVPGAARPDPDGTVDRAT